MSKVYADIVFLRGDEADEAMKILEECGEDELFDYLSQWDLGTYDNCDVTDEPRAGGSDTVIRRGDYIISYNENYNYVGMEKIGRKV